MSKFLKYCCEPNTLVQSLISFKSLAICLELLYAHKYELIHKRNIIAHILVSAHILVLWEVAVEVCHGKAVEAVPNTCIHARYQ